MPNLHCLLCSVSCHIMPWGIQTQTLQATEALRAATGVNRINATLWWWQVIVSVASSYHSKDGKMPKAKRLKVWPHFTRKADYEDEDCERLRTHGDTVKSGKDAPDAPWPSTKHISRPCGDNWWWDHATNSAPILEKTQTTPKPNLPSTHSYHSAISATSLYLQHLLSICLTLAHRWLKWLTELGVGG